MGLRYRLRTVQWQFSIPHGHRDVPGGGYASYPNYTGTFTKWYQEMYDYKNSRPYPESACWQRSGEWSGPDGLAVWDNDDQWGDQRVIVGGVGPKPADPDVTYTVTEAKRWETAVTAALSQDVLAPVFLKELPEIRNTYKSLKKKGFGLKAFANRFLAFKFGILPFLSDLNDLALGSERIAQHIKRVNTMAGRTVRLKLSIGQVVGSTDYYRATGFQSVARDQVPWSGQTYIVAHVEVFRRYNDQDRLNLYLDYYGGKLLNVAWELIPYSFVVDWFVDIGGVIDLLGQKNQPQMARPVSASTIVHGSIQVPRTYWGGSAGAQLLGTTNWKLFARTPCPGVSPSSLLGSGLTISRATVGLALLLQKL